MAAKYTLTQTDVAAVNSAAATLGVSSNDLMTVMNYESAGTMNPSEWGGSGGHYMGLIQFSPSNRATYNVTPGMSFADQVQGPVVSYLQDRGVEPGMGLDNIYSAINYGSAVNKAGQIPYGFKDGSGRTLAQNIAAAKANFAKSPYADPAGMFANMTNVGQNAQGQQIPLGIKGPNRVSTGDQVKQWQTYLQSQGLYQGQPIDGKFGKLTQAATKAFQASAGIPDDGVAGRTTMTAAGLGTGILNATNPPDAPGTYNGTVYSPAPAPAAPSPLDVVSAGILNPPSAPPSAASLPSLQPAAPVAATAPGQLASVASAGGVQGSQLSPYVSAGSPAVANVAPRPQLSGSGGPSSGSSGGNASVSSALANAGGASQLSSYSSGNHAPSSSSSSNAGGATSYYGGSPSIATAGGLASYATPSYTTSIPQNEGFPG